MKNLIFFVFLSVNIYAQESSEFFLKYIPDKFRNSENDIVTIKNILDAIPEINLDLYYYFIEALELDNVNENKNAFKKFLSQFNYEKYKQKIAFAKWNEKQINIILDSDIEEDIKKKACSNFYSTSSLDEKKDSITNFIEPDFNKISFYKLIYYTNDNSKEFDPHEKYDKLVNNVEEEILNEFRSVQKELKNGVYPHTVEIPLFDKFKKTWYLFYYKIHYDDELHNYVLDYYKHNFSVDEDFSNWVISLHYNYNSLSTFEGQVNTKSPFVRQLQENIKINQLGFSIGYRHKLKNQKSIFSFINLDFSFAYGRSVFLEKLNGSSKTLTTFSEDFERTNIYELSFPFSKNKVSSASYLGLSVSTPIYYLIPDLVLSLGSTVYLNIFDYDLEYKYILKSTYIIKDIAANENIDELVINSGEEIFSSDRLSIIGINPFAELDYTLFSNFSVGLKAWVYFQTCFVKLCF